MKIKISVLTGLLMLLLCGCSANDDVEPETNAPPQVIAAIETGYLSVEPENDIDLSDSGITVVYAVNSSAAGRVVGETEQDITAENNKTMPVKAEANLGYKFVRWSDGSINSSRPGDTAVENRVITAVFDYDVLEIPVISMTTETGGDVMSRTEYINADFDIYNAGDRQYDLKGMKTGIRGRGNNTWGYPKKSYKLSLDEKKNLLGLGGGEARMWVLLANVCDQSLLRNHIAFEYARSLDGIAFAPASTPVDFYLNGEYRGVYLLAEEININKYRVDVSEKDIEHETDIGYLIEMTAKAKEPVFTAAGKQFQVHNGLSSNASVRERQIGYIADYVERCWQAVAGGYYKEIDALIDLDSAVDTYLVAETLKNLDIGYDNFYMSRDRGGKLCFGPLWDFDLSQGNANEGCEFYYDLYVSENLKFQSNLWYFTLMDYTWFRDLVLDRWDEIKAETDALPFLVREAAQSGFRALSRNFQKWQIFGTSQNRETELITSLRTYTEHYEYLAQWIENRNTWINEFIHTQEYLDGANNTDQPYHSPAYITANAYGNSASEEIMVKYDSLNHKIVGSSIYGSSRCFDNEGVENAFDGRESTKYCFVGEGETVITFNTKVPVTVSGYVFQTANDTQSYPERNPDLWSLYGSNDGSIWEIISESTAAEAEMGGFNFVYYGMKVEKPQSYMYYKIVITESGTLQFSEFSLYG